MLHKLIQVGIGSPLGVLLFEEDLWVPARHSSGYLHFTAMAVQRHGKKE
jgi:hypothetical protein